MFSSATSILRLDDIVAFRKELESHCLERINHLWENTPLLQAWLCRQEVNLTWDPLIHTNLSSISPEQTLQYVDLALKCSYHPMIQSMWERNPFCQHWFSGYPLAFGHILSSDPHIRRASEFQLIEFFYSVLINGYLDIAREAWKGSQSLQQAVEKQPFHAIRLIKALLTNVKGGCVDSFIPECLAQLSLNTLQAALDEVRVDPNVQVNVRAKQCSLLEGAIHTRELANQPDVETNPKKRKRANTASSNNKKEPVYSFKVTEEAAIGLRQLSERELENLGIQSVRKIKNSQDHSCRVNIFNAEKYHRTCSAYAGKPIVSPPAEFTPSALAPKSGESGSNGPLETFSSPSPPTASLARSPHTLFGNPASPEPALGPATPAHEEVGEHWDAWWEEAIAEGVLPELELTPSNRP